MDGANSKQSYRGARRAHNLEDYLCQGLHLMISGESQGALWSCTIAVARDEYVLFPIRVIQTCVDKGKLEANMDVSRCSYWSCFEIDLVPSGGRVS